MRSILFTLAAATALVSPAGARAAESFDTCTGFIDALPAVVSTPGTWCLRKTLTTAIASGEAIRIAASNVHVACHGHRIQSVAVGPTTAIGLSADIAGHGVTLSGCVVRGFDTGVFLDGGGHVLRDSRLESNRRGVYAAQNLPMMDPWMDAPIEIRDNVVVDSTTVGIRTYGRAVIAGNTVDGVANPSDMGFGIDVESTGTTVVEDNIVRNVAASAAGGGAIGTSTPNYGVAVIRRNTVVAMPGTEDAVGIDCHGGLAHANVVSGYAVAVGDGCPASATLHIP